MKIKRCNKDCRICLQRNGRTDALGYPFMFECMKYDREIKVSEFQETKEFVIEEAV